MNISTDLFHWRIWALPLDNLLLFLSILSIPSFFKSLPHSLCSYNSVLWEGTEHWDLAEGAVCSCVCACRKDHLHSPPLATLASEALKRWPFELHWQRGSVYGWAKTETEREREEWEVDTSYLIVQNELCMCMHTCQQVCVLCVLVQIKAGLCVCIYVLLSTVT